MYRNSLKREGGADLPDKTPHESSKGDASAPFSTNPICIPCASERLKTILLYSICPLFCFLVFILLPALALYVPKDKPRLPHGPPLIDICNLTSVPYPDVANMTLPEKVGQMMMVADDRIGCDGWDASEYNLGAAVVGPNFWINYDSQNATAWVPRIRKLQQCVSDTRLKIPLLYGTDAVHGANNVYGATIFPHNIGLGATRDPVLVREIAAATAREMVATGIRWTFAPCLAVCRDPRWGRCYESFGEDPTLVSLMGSAVDGLQNGTRLPTTNVAATVKHWVGDGGTTNGVNTGNTELSFDDLYQMHITPYLPAIDYNVQFVMASFSSVNGIRMTVNKYLLSDILKGQLGFKGVLVSDWDALNSRFGFKSFTDAIKDAVNAGMDLFMIPDNYKDFIQRLIHLVNTGQVPMSRIDNAVTRILEAKRFLGLFNQTCSPLQTPQAVLRQMRSPQNRQVARTAVSKSLVLLKTEPGLFPLPLAGAKILVAGPHADDVALQCGGWTLTWQGQAGSGVPGTSILAGIKNATASLGDRKTVVQYVAKPNGQEVADYGIVVVGEPPYAETNGDDPKLELSPEASSIIQTVCGKMRCVVVLISGRPLTVESLLPSMNALVAAWLPGSEGGGISDVLFGRNDFSGALSISWPRTINQLPMNSKSPSYDPLFRYGFGLNKAGQVLNITS